MATENSEDLPLSKTDIGTEYDSGMSLEEVRAEMQRIGRQLSRRAIRVEDGLKKLDVLSLLAAGRDQLIEGLGNRRFFDAKLTEEINRSLRTGDPLVLITLDLDKFKPVNDTLGHEAGDNVLKDVGTTLRSVSRRSDTVARLGGDEFGIVLPGINYLYGLIVAARILQAIPDTTPRGFDFISASIGLSQYFPGETPRDMSRRADQGLYAAKDAGRNGIGMLIGLNSDISLESIRQQLEQDTNIRSETKHRTIQTVIARTILVPR